jgi:amidase
MEVSMIELNDEHVVFSFDRYAEPVLTVKSGETVRIHTKDCFGEQIKSYNDNLDEIDWDAINPATGPVYVEQAVPGGSLRVEILNIELHNQAVCSTGKNEGVYGDLLSQEVFHLCKVEGQRLVWDEKLSLPVRPMIGVIGVAPAKGPVNCGTPDTHGGNMDSNKITVGAVLHFPVSVAGALFACGDMHALMGDGEIGVSGAEIGGWATVRLTAEPDLHLTTPVFENDDEFGVIYSAETLDEAADKAVHILIDLVAERTGAKPSELAMLFSLVGNVEVCQMVDPLRTIRFVVPKTTLGAFGFAL